MTLHGTRLTLLATIAGTGGTVAAHAADDGHAVYLTTVIAGATVSVGLEDDDARQLVAVLERQLRARSAERRLDPAGLCRCGDQRVSHRDSEGACLAPECPCLVMRPVATVPFCTVHAADQHGTSTATTNALTLGRAGFWDT
jgi:hypothetical protein